MQVLILKSTCNHRNTVIQCDYDDWCIHIISHQFENVKTKGVLNFIYAFCNKGEKHGEIKLRRIR